MTRPSIDAKALLPLERAQPVPLYLQLYRRYRDAIAAGTLQPGDRVSSARSLASELNLSRGTVEVAYQMLTSEGYLQARGPAGTVVAMDLMPLAAAVPEAPATPSTPAPDDLRAAASQLQPFQLGLPALDAFARKTWTRLTSQASRSLGVAAMAYPPATGHLPLRQALAGYLGVARGIVCSPEQVFVTAGYRSALDLICRTLLAPGAAGWYEAPGYPFARQFLLRAGLHLTPVPVDAEGLQVQTGLQLAGAARFAVVTPTHQSPLGVALSLARRLQLLAWAEQAQAWIIEDDYDSEFRYHGRPLPALKSLDRSGRVLYTGTLSKVLFPGLQLAYLVVPADQVNVFRDVANHLSGPGSILPQATVAAFIEQGHFARHLRRMRGLYAVRRAALAAALTAVFGGRLTIQPQAGGLHLLAWLPPGHDDRALAARARAAGLAVQALSDWGAMGEGPGGLLMGFTGFSDAEQARQAVRRLREVIGPLADDD